MLQPLGITTPQVKFNTRKTNQRVRNLCGKRKFYVSDKPIGTVNQANEKTVNQANDREYENKKLSTLLLKTESNPKKMRQNSCITSTRSKVSKSLLWTGSVLPINMTEHENDESMQRKKRLSENLCKLNFCHIFVDFWKSLACVCMSATAIKMFKCTTKIQLCCWTNPLICTVQLESF